MIQLPLETEALANRLAAAHRLSVEETIHKILERQARAEGLVGAERSRDDSAEAVAARAERTNALVAKFSAMPVLDTRSPDEIMNDLDPL